MSEPGSANRRRTAILLLIALAISVYGIDQLSKFWVVNNLEYGVPVPVIGDVLQFYFVRNSGAAFSLASGSTWIFSILASAVTIFVVWYSSRIRSLGWAVFLGLLLGGTLGNLSDRFFREPGFAVGHVVDFISMPWLIPAIYNLADVAIVSSMVVFVILTFRGIRIDGRREMKPASSPSPDRIVAGGPGGTAGDQSLRDGSESSTEEPSTEEPSTEEPSTEEPSTEETVADEPTVDSLLSDGVVPDDDSSDADGGVRRGE